MKDIEEIIYDIEEVLQAYCDKESFDVEIEIGTDCAYCEYEDGSKGVTMALIFPSLSDKLFMYNMFNNGLKYDCGDFIASFCHEIGHYHTLNWLTEEERDDIISIKEQLDGSLVEDNLTYQQLLDEKLATDWAIEYINSNKGKLSRLAKQLQNLIAEIDLEEE